MKYINKKQILLLHDQIIKKYGGRPGIRDNNLLESAIYAPFQTFGSEELYPDILSKTARLGYGLIKNHPFIDGNKRIGAHVIFTLLYANGIFANYKDKELINIIFSVADGTCDEKQFLYWLYKHTHA